MANKVVSNQMAVNKTVFIIAVVSLMMNFIIIGWLAYYYNLVASEFGRYATAVSNNNLFIEYEHACRVEKNEEACKTVEQAKRAYIGAMNK